MKFCSRVIGTWLLGLGLVLLIVDGVRTATDAALSLTPLGALWEGLHRASFEMARESLTAMAETISAGYIAETFFSVPGWIVFGVVGILFLMLGRQRSKTKFIATH